MTAIFRLLANCSAIGNNSQALVYDEKSRFDGIHLGGIRNRSSEFCTEVRTSHAIGIIHNTQKIAIVKLAACSLAINL
jgi:hypothetical protein